MRAKQVDWLLSAQSSPTFFLVTITRISLCSSRFWAATAPSFKGNLRLNLNQSKVAESAAGSRITTTTVCELAKFRRNHILTKKALRSLCSRKKTFAECTQVPLKRATLNTDGRGCVARSPDKGTTKCHRNTHQTSFQTASGGRQ
jgi:hypothetical protein